MKMNKIIRITILMIAISLMSFSGYRLYDIYSEYKKGNDLYNNIAEEFVNISENTNTLDEKESETKKSNSEIPSISNQDNELEEGIDINVDFEALIESNEDIIGWIYSPDTPINYPIVQSEDNNYYLRRMLDGTYNTAGTIFMDYRNNKDLTDLNTIIYGHNMKNNSMFGTLDLYKEQEYYEKHPLVYLISPHQTIEIELIAGLVVSERSEIYDIPNDQDSLNSLYKRILEKSTFKSNVLLEEGDRLVTLSTCSYENDSARYVVVGKITS